MGQTVYIGLVSFNLMRASITDLLLICITILSHDICSNWEYWNIVPDPLILCGYYSDYFDMLCI